jgi:copper chaperone NosL
MRALTLALTLVVVTGCAAAADGPPAIAIDRTACSHCGMLISEPVFAAAYQTAGSEPRVFDDIGCLIAAARAEGSGSRRFWFHDSADRAWMDGEGAAFVASSRIQTPMAGGILAYRTEAAAAAAAGRHAGELVRTLGDLLARGGGRP